MYCSSFELIHIPTEYVLDDAENAQDFLMVDIVIMNFDVYFIIIILFGRQNLLGLLRKK
jgi:hypothetical protein